MKFEDLIKKRETTYEFSNKAISTVNLNKILEAGRLSPSFLNLQPWKFLVIKDTNIIGQLMKTAYYGGFHSDPTIVIVPVLITKMCYGKNFSQEKKEMGIVEGIKSLSMASLNMSLQAADLEIGSAILSPKENEAKKILGISTKDKVSLIIAFGYNKENAFKKNRERKSLKEILNYN